MLKYLYLLVGVGNLYYLMLFLMTGKLPNNILIGTYMVFFVVSMILQYYELRMRDKLKKSMGGIMEIVDQITKDDSLTFAEKQSKFNEEIKKLNKGDK